MDYFVRVFSKHDVIFRTNYDEIFNRKVIINAYDVTSYSKEMLIFGLLTTK